MRMKGGKVMNNNFLATHLYDCYKTEKEKNNETNIINMFLELYYLAEKETKNEKDIESMNEKIKELDFFIQEHLRYEYNIYVTNNRRVLCKVLELDAKEEFEFKQFEFWREYRRIGFWNLCKEKEETNVEFLSRRIHYFRGFDDGTKYF